MGIELMSELGTGIQFVDPLQVYAPKRNVRVNLANPAAAFNKSYLHSPGVVFIVNQQKYDARYILTSLDFARKLFGYRTEVSAIELKLKPGYDTGRAQQEIQDILGDRYRVQDRYEQQADVFRIMKIEKLISYLFLTFILVIACFNVIGSLSMLILDKREDVETLRNLGADEQLIARIFLFEGRLIATFGAIAGIAGGTVAVLPATGFRAYHAGRRKRGIPGRSLSRQRTCHGRIAGIRHRHRRGLPVRLVSGALFKQEIAVALIRLYGPAVPQTNGKSATARRQQAQTDEARGLQA